MNLCGKRSALINSKPEPKGTRIAGPNKLKIWISSKRTSSSNMPKIRAIVKKRSDSNVFKT